MIFVRFVVHYPVFVKRSGSFVQFPPGRGGAPPPPAGRAAGAAAPGDAAVGAAAGARGRAGAAAAGNGRGAGLQSAFSDLPAFCRVTATLMPGADSEIRMKLWMPAAASWNGKLRGTGNGGLGGGAAVNPGALAGSVRLGYATTTRM